MDNKKDDLYYINKIIENATFSIDNVINVSLQDFEKDEILLNAIMFSFIPISENASHMSDAFKFAHPDIAWNEIRGIRNKIVHNYDVVEASIVYDTVVNDNAEILTMWGKVTYSDDSLCRLDVSTLNAEENEYVAGIHGGTVVLEYESKHGFKPANVLQIVKGKNAFIRQRYLNTREIVLY